MAIVTSCLQVLQNFKKCFCEGQLVRCNVLGPKKDTKKKGVYDLSMIGEKEYSKQDLLN